MSESEALRKQESGQQRNNGSPCHCHLTADGSATALLAHRAKMDNTEEPQKKIFKARKTMKASDRQQLEAVHKAKEDLLKPTEQKLVNGNHENGDSDMIASYDTDHMADQTEINGVIDAPLDTRELPALKLSDLKESMKNHDQTDLNEPLELQFSHSPECQEKKDEDITEANVQTTGDQGEAPCDDLSSTIIDSVDQTESNECPSVENKPCDAEVSEDKSEQNVFEEMENHILLDGIHELEEETPEEDMTEAKPVEKSIDVLSGKQDEQEDKALDGLEETPKAKEDDSGVAHSEEKVLEEESQEEPENNTAEEQEDALDAHDDNEEHAINEDKTNLVNEEQAEEETDMVTEDDGADDKNEAEMQTVDKDAGEETISSSMEIDQNPGAVEQKSWDSEATSDKPASDLQAGPVLESADSMETDEIIPILEKLAPVEDEPLCLPEADLQSEHSVTNDDKDKTESTLTSPSKQENSDNLPSGAFLVLSDEDPCDESALSAEEKNADPQDASDEVQEEPAEKEEAQKVEEAEKQPVEKTDIFRRKRSKSEDLDSESSKRRRFEEEDYDAELQVKITAGVDLNVKLQKVIHKMLEEKLNVLQCAIFDKTLADLKTRVEKIECKKHENILCAIQAKISRLTKRFGAAKDDFKKRPEPSAAIQPPSPGKTANEGPAGNNALTYRNASTVRQMLETKRNVSESTTTSAALPTSSAGQSPAPAASSTPLRTTNSTQLSVSQSQSSAGVQGRTQPDWKLIQQRINAASIGTPQNLLSSQSKPSPPVPSTSVMTSVLPAPSTTTVVGNTQVSGNNTQPMSVSLQSLPVILHVPVAMSSQSQILQGTTGTLVTNQQSGNVEFIPVQNAAAISNLNKAPSVTIAQTKPIASPSMVSPGIQRNSPANPSTPVAVQAIPTTPSAVQPSRTPLSATGAASSYNQVGNRNSVQMKPPQSAFNSALSSESPVASRPELQTNRTPAAENVTNKRTAESSTPGGKSGSGVIDLTLDEEDLESTSQDSRRMSSSGTSGNAQSSQAMSRPSQPQQANMPPSAANAAPSQATIHVLPTAQTTVNVNQRSVPQPPARVMSAPRAPNTQQMVYTTALSTTPSQTPGRNTIMQNQNLRQVSPQTGGMPVRMPQAATYVVNSGMSVGSSGPQLTVHHRPQEQGRPIHPAPLPEAPQPPRLPPEASNTSAPQKPHLKLARVQSQNGIVLSWSVLEVDRTCAAVDSYHLYAYHEDPAATSSSQWKKIGEVKALPLPMACTLTQFVSGSKYYFAVRAKDIYGRFGPFCDPQSTDVISTQNS
ncbi:activating transcription factor 7-interacting protein 1 [Bombina bombina]|uniref:activating transcription factor 7-interacting protein 1 n=1 Tax=Bombina bombina TaxID=8345 RepID=UPI00235A50B4|nr:activating transcription factor 7-interacting protein 1 [Bombina bombina]